MSTWVLVADSSRARLLKREKNRSLTETEAFVCPEERLREQDLTSDRGGRSFDSSGSGRHGMEPATSQHERVAIDFARQLAEERGFATRWGPLDLDFPVRFALNDQTEGPAPRDLLAKPRR